MVDCACSAPNPSPVVNKVGILDYQEIKVGHFKGVHADPTPCIGAAVTLNPAPVDDKLVPVGQVIEGYKYPPSVESCYIVSYDSVFYQDSMIVRPVKGGHNSPAMPPGNIEARPICVSNIPGVDASCVVDEGAVFDKDSDWPNGPLSPQQ